MLDGDPQPGSDALRDRQLSLEDVPLLNYYVDIAGIADSWAWSRGRPDPYLPAVSTVTLSG